MSERAGDPMAFNGRSPAPSRYPVRTTVNALITRIRDYVKHWNTDAKPFTWTASTDKILAKVRMVQTNIKKPVRNNG